MRSRPPLPLAALVLAIALGPVLAGTCAAGPPCPLLEFTDLSSRDRLVILVFGDSGTGWAGQYRVGAAMAEVCLRERCDLGLLLGDALYDDGVEAAAGLESSASYDQIVGQFAEKFEKPYAELAEIPGFKVWVVAGNHDYRRNAVQAMLDYSLFSDLWRMPALHYEIPGLPPWLQVYGLHTDVDVRRDLNGLQIAAASRALCAEKPDDRWRMVFGHHPVHNSGHHRDDANERAVRRLVENPVLRACGVHLYLSGHAHHQEHVTARGYEQVIQGAAGKRKGSNRGTRFDVRQRHFSDEFGFGILTVERERVRVDYYDVVGTREQEATWRPPRPEEVVRSYSFCATREEIGRPERDAGKCPAE